jgi:hypothetical protein
MLKSGNRIPKSKDKPTKPAAGTAKNHPQVEAKVAGLRTWAVQKGKSSS